MDDEVYAPGWQHDLRNEWLLVSAGFFNGFVSASLDKFLTDDERVAAVLRASQRSIQSLRAFGAYVSAAFLNALGLSGFTADLPIVWFERMADWFAKLLRGELMTDASTSPTLPATRDGQSWDEIEQPRNAEPSVAPNGSPTTPVSNSGGTEGQPPVN